MLFSSPIRYCDHCIVCCFGCSILTQLLPIDEHEKAKLLPIRSARLRLRLVVHWIERLQSQWCVMLSSLPLLFPSPRAYTHPPVGTPTPLIPPVIARGITPLPLTPVCSPPLKGAFLRICVPAAGGSLVDASSADARGVWLGRASGRHWLRCRPPGRVHGAKCWEAGQWVSVAISMSKRREFVQGRQIWISRLLLHLRMSPTI